MDDAETESIPLFVTLPQYKQVIYEKVFNTVFGTIKINHTFATPSEVAKFIGENP